MKILAPIDHLGEAERLIQAGADELYGGFIPPEWRDTYSDVGSINKRTFVEAQFASAGELASAVELAHERRVRFFLTLNNDYYSAGQYPAVLAEVERAIELGVDALLVADIGLIREVARRGYGIELHLSILAAVLNREAAAFYRDLGAARVVLDRSLTLPEIAGIIEAVKDVEFEVFVRYGKCPNIEGLCTLFHHDDPRHVWPCGQEYRIDAVSDDGAGDMAREAQGFWRSVSRGNACGLCAMFDLEQAGISALKIAGRGRKTEDKVSAVKTIEALRQMLLSGVEREVFYQTAVNLYREEYGVLCDPYVCYQPELRRRFVGQERR